MVIKIKFMAVSGVKKLDEHYYKSRDQNKTYIYIYLMFCVWDCAVMIWPLVLYFECCEYLCMCASVPCTCSSLWTVSADCRLLCNMFLCCSIVIIFWETVWILHPREALCSLGIWEISSMALLKIQLNFLLLGYHSSNTLCMWSISPVRPQAIKKSNCITVYQYKLICLNNQSVTMPYSSVICNPTLKDNLKAASEWISSSGSAIVERGQFWSLKPLNGKNTDFPQ